MPSGSYTTTDPTGNLQVQAQGGTQSGNTNNQQTVNANQTGSTSGTTVNNNTYLPWQSGLQQTAGNAAANYVQSGGPPPGVTGAPPALVSAYMSQFNQNVAPQIAAAQGPGSGAIGSNLALGLEQLNAGVYGTNLSAYQNAIAQAGALGFNAVGNSGANSQSSAGASNQASSNNTQQSQNWQQALADLNAIAGTHTVSGIIP